MFTNLRQWLIRDRSSPRLALVLQMASRAASSGMAFVWSRLLLGAMGKEINGCFIEFLNLASFGGLGDLGMGGAINYRLVPLLAPGKEREAGRFLTVARGLFLVLGLGAAVTFFLLEPGFRRSFGSVTGLGSTAALFAVGALAVAALIFQSYSANVNYACGNLVWPVLPAFLLAQMGLAGHWLVARSGGPLWLQYTPYVVVAGANCFLAQSFVRYSHPGLGTWWPLRFDPRVSLGLLESSAWVCLCSLGNKIFVSTDAILVGRGFGHDQVPGYTYNYKACELALFVATTTSYVAMPKIARWLASPAPEDRDRARLETRRLNQFQSLFGAFAALAYLAGNGWFLHVWWWHAKETITEAPLLLQTAFALNLVVSTCGDATIQVTGRTGPAGLRYMGIIVAAMGGLNLGLSLLAVRYHFLAGIALATVLSQAGLSLLTAAYSCRHLRESWGRWAVFAVLLPVALVSLAGWLRSQLSPYTLPGAALLGVSYTVLLILFARLIGLTPAMLRRELALVGGLGKRRPGGSA